MAATKRDDNLLFGRNYKGDYEWGYFVTTKRVAIDVAMFLAATKKVAMDGGIFWPQLKGWLWMGLFSSRN